MEKKHQNLLFDEFKTPSVNEWYLVAQKEIKKEDLCSSTYENLELKPIYTLKDLEELKNLKDFQHNKQRSEEGWLYIQQITAETEKEANKRALDALQGGADGVYFSINQPITLSSMLEGIWLDHCVIAFNIQKSNIPVIESYLAHYKNQKKKPQDLRGWCVFDPIRDWLIEGEENLTFSKDFKKLVDQSSDYPNFKPLTISSQHIANSGGNIIQELSYVLAVTVEYLEAFKAEGTDLQGIFQRVLYSLTVTTNFFFEISKLRALRVLLTKVAEAYQINLQPSDITIHTSTSEWNKSGLDFYNNVIRNTGEGLAAVVGGTNYLTISDFSISNEGDRSLEQRTSRNISHILKEEAYLDKVVDPAAGSYYVESLTAKIQEEAWKGFLQIESEGGLIKTIKKGNFASSILQLGQLKMDDLDLRKDTLIGVNIYPNLKEECPRPPTADKKIGQLHPQRLAYGIEDLRNWVENTFKCTPEQRPKLAVINLAGQAIDKATLQLLKNAFSSIGFVVDFSKNNVLDGSSHRMAIIVLGNNLDAESEAAIHTYSQQCPIILTSEDVLTMKEQYKDIYAPIKKLVLHGNLKKILSHLDLEKK